MQQDNSEDGWWPFLDVCAQLGTKEQLNELFSLFLTFDERKDVADRFLIIRDLLQGKKTQREMADELQVSIAKITRGSNSLKIIGDDLREYLIRQIN